MTTVRLEKGSKEKFDLLCKGFGMSVNTAFTIFVNKVIEEKRIPFSIGKEYDGRGAGLSLLDGLSGAWDDGVPADKVAEDLRTSRAFGLTRTIPDY